MQTLIDMSLQLGNEPIDTDIKPASVELNELRSMALTLLVDLWKSYPHRFSRRGGEV